VGIAPGAGYRIITANFMAQLVEASSEFGATGTDGGGATEGAIKKRVPVREMLKSLQGDTKALGDFIMVVNDLREDDTWPTVRVVWKSEDIDKAISGDKVLEAKLVRDLNMNLDGTPLGKLNFDSLENGIIVDFPVDIELQIGDQMKNLVGRVQTPYRPRIMKAVEQRLKDKGNVTREMQAGYYQEEAAKILDKPAQREIVSQAIRDMYAKSRIEELRQIPSRVLGSANVVVSDAFITGARYVSYDGPEGKPLYNLIITLNEEGRKRLWQFSKKRVGAQLLVTANGIPVAAPRISHALSQSELTVTQMQDRLLVEEAVSEINKSKEQAKIASASQ
jgi:hypothetical protein